MAAVNGTSEGGEDSLSYGGHQPHRNLDGEIKDKTDARSTSHLIHTPLLSPEETPATTVQLHAAGYDCPRNSILQLTRVSSPPPPSIYSSFLSHPTFYSVVVRDRGQGRLRSPRSNLAACSLAGGRVHEQGNNQTVETCVSRISFPPCSKLLTLLKTYPRLRRK